MVRGSEGNRVATRIEDLDTPAVLIEQAILDSNILRMQQLANNHGLQLRPHVKTHKSVVLARKQIAAGAIGIAVAKLSEAEVFASNGFTDIQIANQVVGQQKIERLARLAQRVDISCAVDSVEHIQAISNVFSSIGLTANLFIEVDTGLRRAGVADYTDASRLAQRMSETGSVRLAGLLTHAGHAYAAKSYDEVRLVAQREGEQTVRWAQQLRSEGFDIPTVSVGSTPTSATVAQVLGVTELRVGNYIFNDMIQVALGVATQSQCALSVLSSVTSVHPDRIVIDAGSKVFSSDSGAHGTALVAGFGKILGEIGNLSRLSEEHGVIEFNSPHPYHVGQKIRIIPNHACPVMNLAQAAYLIDRENVIEMLPIDAQLCVT